MSILVDKFRESVSKSKDLQLNQETNYDVAYANRF